VIPEAERWNTKEEPLALAGILMVTIFENPIAMIKLLKISYCSNTVEAPETRARPVRNGIHDFFISICV